MPPSHPRLQPRRGAAERRNSGALAVLEGATPEWSRISCSSAITSLLFRDSISPNHRTPPMLFKKFLYPEIAAGRVTVAFRRWVRPTVKPGGNLKTPVGVLAIRAVAQVSEEEITARDARAAGYDSRPELLADLARRNEGNLYRIDFEYRGEDPRLALRQETDFSEAEWLQLRTKLERVDAASPSRAWTLSTLRLLEKNPGVRSAELAPQLDQDQPAFKRNVRKLKNLGLTESLGTGYRLSPRGRTVLARLEDEGIGRGTEDNPRATPSRNESPAGRAEPDDVDPLARLRTVCLELPEAHEVEAWGEPTFRIRNRMFATYASPDSHHGAGRPAVWCKAASGNQELMVKALPERFFVPPYVGPSGWIGIWLDTDDVDWGEVADLVKDAYRLVAPQKLAKLL